MDLVVHRQEFGGCAVFADPAGAHGESAVAVTGCEDFAAVADYDEGFVYVFVGDGEGVFVDFEAEFCREFEDIRSFGALAGGLSY